MPLAVEQFLIGNDNYTFLLHDMQTGATAAIDAMAAAPIRAVLEAKKWRLSDIFVTHKHGDHVEGIAELKAHYGCKVTGPAKAAMDVSTLDVHVREGDTVKLAGYSIGVWETPGHCSDHVSYLVSKAGLAFVGDTLFPLGCGRIFDSTPGMMYKSLMRLASLPDDTSLYSGHEYTSANLNFALSVEPGNRALQKRAVLIRAAVAASKPTVPTTVAEEKATNPFLRTYSPEIQQSLGMVGADPVQILAELRERKNKF